MPYKRRNKGKQGESPTTRQKSPNRGHKVVDSAVLPVAHTASSSGNRYDLVLTSEKRRGVYECDYCHSDISQLPRVRCAVCPDFDLCLDCFATTDHTAALARIKAAANTHDALVMEGTATAGSGVSLVALNHDDTLSREVEC
jgi:hypothetical protein